MLCPVGDSGNIVIFAIFAKFASIANFYGPPHYFVLCPVGDCGNIVIFAIFAKFVSIANFYGPLIALYFAMLAILAKLSFLPYLPNSPVSPTFMGPVIALCFALLAIVAILSFLPYLLNSPVSPTFMCPSLLCALPCWRFWQNCHFRHICQIRHYVLFFAIFVVALWTYPLRDLFFAIWQCEDHCDRLQLCAGSYSYNDSTEDDIKFDLLA